MADGPNATLVGLLGIIVGAGIALTSAYLTSKAEFDAKMVEIGVSILSAEPSKTDVSPARDWAIRLVEGHSGEKFGQKDREALLHQSIAVFPKLFSPQNFDCSDWGPIDGGAAWGSQKTGEIVMKGSFDYALITKFCGK
jgi:hypothetical protein